MRSVGCVWSEECGACVMWGCGVVKQGRTQHEIGEHVCRDEIGDMCVDMRLDVCRHEIGCV